MQKILGVFLAFVLISACSQQVKLSDTKKEYALDQVRIKINSPLNWEEEYNSEFRYVTFKKLPDAVMDISNYCIGCEKKSLKEKVEARMKDQFLALEGASYHKKSEIKPGAYLFVLHGKSKEGKEVSFVAVHYLGAKEGIIACEANLTGEMISLAELVEKSCSSLEVVP